MMTWGSWLRPKDSQDRESRTLAFVGITWLALLVRFSLGGLSFSINTPIAIINFAIPSTPMTDFGASVTAVLAIWLGREWIRGK